MLEDLQELIDYFAEQAKISQEMSQHVRKGSPPYLRHSAVAKAYEDAADRLRLFIHDH